MNNNIFIEHKTLTLVLTERCNLSCFYCYEHEKDAAIMPVSLALEKIDAELQKYTGGGLYVCFHGGEPLMAFQEMKQICETIWNRPYKRPYTFYAATNGTLLNSEIKDWTYQNRGRFSLCLSLDGTKKMQDMNRSNSFDKIDIPFFLNTFPEQPVKMTVSPLSLPYMAEGVISMQERGFIVSGSLAQGVTWQVQDYAIYANQVAELVEYYLEHPNIKPSDIVIRPIDKIEAYSGKTSLHRWCGAGQPMETIDMYGNSYPCHVFMPSVSDKNHYKKSNEVNAMKSLCNSAKELVDPKCKGCGVFMACPTCYGMNFMTNGDLVDKGQDNCTFNMIQIKATAYMMKMMLVEKDRYPFVSGKTDGEVKNLIRAINIVDVTLPDMNFMAKVRGEIKGMGL